MTLTTHAVTGAVIGAVASQNLAFAALAAFASHFVFDTIPHWDYPLGTIAKKGLNIDNDMNTRSFKFIIDLVKIGFDFWLGMAIVFVMVMYMPTPIIIGAFVGAFFAVIPDPLQFVYWKLRPRIMAPLQKFHVFMHAHTHLNERHLIGVVSQAVIIILSIVVFRLIFIV